jgi:phytoene synthase
VTTSRNQRSLNGHGTKDPPDQNSARKNLDAYCQEKTGGRGSSVYYRTLFLPPDLCSALVALNAYRCELEDAVDGSSEVDVARMKLDWWRQEISRMFALEPRHPVTRALAPSISEFHLPVERFFDVIEGCVMKVGMRGFADADELHAYCLRIGSSIEILSTEILGYDDPATLDFARALGVALQCTEIINGVGVDARRHRVLIPQDELTRFGVEPQSIRRAIPGKNFQSLMAHQYERAVAAFDRALALLPNTDRPRQTPALIGAAITRARLEEIRKDGFRVLDRKIDLTPLRKFWIAWNTRRRAR